MITIENENFSAGIRLRGAELASLKDRATGRELIWQADPKIWGGSAPILFPIVGKLKNGNTMINGSTYKIPKHGLLRTRDAKLVGQGADFAEFQFKSNNETLEHYPFHYLFTVTFQLLENGIDVNYEISNGGFTSMLYTIGSHPALALDLVSYDLSDYSIVFSERETCDLYGLVDGLLARLQTDYLENENLIRLSNSLFNNDALIFKDIWSRTIRIEPTGVEIDLRNHPHLGIWSKPGAPFVCIEPWHSFDDAADSDGIFENKPGIMTLPAGKTFETGYTIRT